LLVNQKDADHPAIIAPPPLLLVICIIGGLIAAYFSPLPLIHDAARARVLSCVALILVAARLILSGFEN